jgi:hypothetical protein
MSGLLLALDFLRSGQKFVDLWHVKDHFVKCVLCLYVSEELVNAKNGYPAASLLCGDLVQEDELRCQYFGTVSKASI